MTATPTGAAGAVVVYLRAQHDTIAANEPGVRAGDEDAVHDMRVAIRRTRSTLRSFRGMWDRARVDAFRGELKWLADRLGQVRDGQVMATRLAAGVRAEPRDLGMRAFREGGNAFTYGLLHARQQVVGEAALADLPATAKRARRRKVRRWLG
jgi:inorganic triphosphatase YgiF